MTLEEFYSEFSKIAKEFNIVHIPSYVEATSLGQIRHKKGTGNDCPVTIVCQRKTGHYWPGWCISDAAKDLNLDKDTAVDIGYAADGTGLEDNNRAEIRQTLINILNEVNHVSNT